MKQYVLLFMLILSSYAYAQHHWDMKHQHNQEAMKRIKELEKIKLLEYLDLEEETAIKFFVRRSDHKERMQNYEHQKNEIIREISENIENGELDENDPYYIEKLKEIQLLHEKMGEEINVFIFSLNDILTAEQQAKLLVFEQKFRNEIRSLILGGRKHRRK